MTALELITTVKYLLLFFEQLLPLNADFAAQDSTYCLTDTTSLQFVPFTLQTAKTAFTVLRMQTLPL